MHNYKCLFIGDGQLKISTVHNKDNNMHGLKITPVTKEEAQPVNSKFITDDPMNPDCREGTIIIWAKNLEGVRVLQDTVNSLALFMNGYVVEDQPNDWTPSTYSLTKNIS